jgi:hypothetical protein
MARNLLKHDPEFPNADDGYCASADRVFIAVVQAVKELAGKGTKYLTTKRVRKYLRIPSEEWIRIRKVSTSLIQLENYGILKLVNAKPKLFEVLPSPEGKIEKLLRMYRKRTVPKRKVNQ